MESDDLRVVLGLSSFNSDMQWKWKGIFKFVQEMELF